MTYQKFALAAVMFSSVLLGFGCKSYKVSTTGGADQMVRNISIKAGDKVTSPLIFTGEAKGPYYFEASFPIELKDANGKVLGIGLGKAQGDWMTENYVPFEAKFSFSPATTTDGVLTLKRDNPSGEAKNDASYDIPVTFK